MRFLRTAGYSMLVAVFLVLASGRFLNRGPDASAYPWILAGTGVVLLAAAGAVLVHSRTGDAGRRVLLYGICAGMIAGVQLTGGYQSFLYFTYMVFLMWVSMSSSGGSATEFGLVIGFTEFIALLNSSIWTGDGSVITRLLPLLLPALRSLLVPFIFGLVSEWLSEREPFGVESSKRAAASSERDAERGTDENVYSKLIELYHAGSGADFTGLFLPDQGGYLRLEEHASTDGMVISRFMLPQGHRLSRLAIRSSDPVMIKAQSRDERGELAPYRLSCENDVESLWIIICPLAESHGDEAGKGFILQEFHGEKPDRSRVDSLVSLAGSLSGRKSTGTIEDESAWTTRLVSACTEETLEMAVNGLASVLSTAVQGSTVSVAQVDNEKNVTRIAVSLGPIAGKRRGRTYGSSGGVAGWILRNRVPCRRSRLSQGVRNVSCFDPENHSQARTGSIMGVPVMRGERVHALIMMEHQDDDAFKPHHENLLSAAAGMLSMREELDDLRSRFRSMSGRDTLTGMPGIALFARHLNRMAKEVQIYGWYVGVIVADIDGFDELNQKLGYSQCDLLLKRAANLFRECFQREVYVARIGPDSFAACLPRAGKAVMEAMCQRAADALSFRYSAAQLENPAEIPPADGLQGTSGVAVTASIGGVYTHVNRKVLILTGEAEKAMDMARAAAPGSCMVKKLDLTEFNGDRTEVGNGEKP